MTDKEKEKWRIRFRKGERVEGRLEVEGWKEFMDVLDQLGDPTTPLGDALETESLRQVAESEENRPT